MSCSRISLLRVSAQTASCSALKGVEQRDSEPRTGQSSTLVYRPMSGLITKPYFAPKMALTSTQVSWELPSTTSNTAPGPSSLLPFLHRGRCHADHKLQTIMCQYSWLLCSPDSLHAANTEGWVCMQCAHGSNSGSAWVAVPPHTLTPHRGSQTHQTGADRIPAGSSLHDLRLAGRIAHDLAAAVGLVPSMAAQDQQGRVGCPAMAGSCVWLQTAPAPAHLWSQGEPCGTRRGWERRRS